MRNILFLLLIIGTGSMYAQNYEHKSYVVSNGACGASQYFCVAGEPLVAFDIQAGNYTGDIGFLSTVSDPNVQLPLAVTYSVSNFNSFNINCFGGNDGWISTIVSGGVPPYVYSWNTGGTNSSLTNLTVGVYELTVQDNASNTVVETIVLTEPAEITTTYMVINESGAGNADGALDVSVSGGSGGYSYMWSNGATTEDISALSAGIYTLSVTDWNGCEIEETFEITQQGTTVGSPNWNVINTGSSHSILVQTTASMAIDGTPLSSGDYLGVFFDSLGTLACGGYVEWNNSNTVINVWGADVGNDGFATGETFKWKIWRASDGAEFDAIATYIPAPMMPNQGEFAANGMSGLTSLEAITVEYHYIDLPQGWSLFSTYIDLFEPNIDSVLSDIVAEVIICKDGFGGTFWPQWGVNLIGDGYQIKMDTAQTLITEGIAVVPELTPIVIPQGWSLKGYLRQTSASIVTMLSPIVSEVIIVKNGSGGTYWPLYGVNLIGNMNPGEGYQFKMNSQQSLTYPANTMAFSKSEFVPHNSKYFGKVPPTNNNMTLGIPLSAWEAAPANGDELGVYAESGILIGSGVFKGNNMAITLWGNDELSDKQDGLMNGETFAIRFWNGEEHSLEVGSWQEGDGSYGANKIAIVGQITQNSDLRTYELYQNTPNPFSNSTEFSFYLPETTQVEFTILNVLGEVVEVLTKEEMAEGKHTLRYETKNLESGTYYYNLRTPSFSATKKMVVMR